MKRARSRVNPRASTRKGAGTDSTTKGAGKGAKSIARALAWAETQRAQELELPDKRASEWACVASRPVKTRSKRTQITASQRLVSSWPLRITFAGTQLNSNRVTFSRTRDFA